MLPKNIFFYFNLAKELNLKYHNKLIKCKLHFRGNINSISIISVEKEKAEKGISNIKTKDEAINKLELINDPNEDLKIKTSERITPEKELQAWIINFTMNNNWYLPFGNNIHYLTSELAIYSNNSKIVNDILAIDNSGTLCIIELKSLRDNKVKQQTINFEKVIKSKSNHHFFENLLNEISIIPWNNKIRKISVWPKSKGKIKKRIHLDVEEVNYIYDEKREVYKFENNSKTLKV